MENLRKEGLTERDAEREGEVEGPNRFVKGEHIECNYRGLDKWYKGVIINVNRNDTYDRKEKDWEKNVGRSII